MSHARVLMYVMAVPLLGWVGVAYYLWRIDRAVSRLERRPGGKEQA